MNYPSRLLPSYNYKIITLSDELFVMFLSHHTQTKELCMVGTNKINSDILITPTKRMEDLSTNLLGVFLLEDNQIELIGENKEHFTSTWNVGETVNITPQHDIDFICNPNRGCVFWKIEDFVKLQFSHTNNITNTIYNLAFKVSHTPIKCNFWHFSIRVFANDIDLSELGIGDKLKKSLLKKAKEQLIECVITNTPTFHEIDLIYYTN